MKLFFIQILKFVLPIIILSPLLDKIISDRLKESDYYARGEINIWNTILEGEIDSDFYIYGSSRAWTHFNTEILDRELGVNSYNFGIDGHYIWLQHLRHKLLFKNNPKPKVLVLSVDIFTLTDYNDIPYLNEATHFYNAKQFLPFLHNNEVQEYTSEYKGYSYLDYKLPMIRYFGYRKAIFEALKIKETVPFRNRYRLNGFRGADKSWTGDMETKRELMNLYEVKFHQPYINLLEDIIAQCKTMDVKVIFVYTPEYFEGQPHIKNREQMINFYSNMAKENDIPFLDYSNDPISHNRNLFYNIQHLNSKGADIFTKKFAQDLLNRNIIKQ